MTFARFPSGGYPGDSAGWTAQKAWMDAQRARLPNGGAAPAQQPNLWQPGYLGTPQTPYPANPYAQTASTTGGRSGGGGGYGGGGMSYSGPFISVDPETSLGAGSYWPGHSQERAAQNQAAMLGIMAGTVSPDTRNPAQMAAAMAAQRNSVNPNARRMAGGNGSAFGTGGGSAGRGGLAGGYQSAYDMAQQANEARYGDIMSGYQALRQANVGAGAQEARDINLNWDAQAASDRQNLIGRGLGNSSTLQAAMQGSQTKRQDSLGRLGEKLRREDSGLLADQLGFMERRTDEGPDMNQAIALAQGLGAAGSQAPRVIGTQVVPTMGGVGYTGGGGYSMPTYAASGFAGQTRNANSPLVAAGVTPQQVRAAHVLANQGHAGAQAWLRILQKRMG